MSRRPFQFIITLVGICLFLILTNRYVLHDALGNGAMNVIGRPAVYVFNKVGIGHSFLVRITEWRILGKENDSLRAENAELKARNARIEALQEENASLRRAVEISDAFNIRVLPGGIFHADISPLGVTALVNKGAGDGVRIGDVVVSERNALIGKVIEAGSSFARVQLLTDPQFEIGGKVAGNDIKGIIKGNLDQGLSLGLIVQGDAVKEGDLVVSNGNDMFLAGLVIGTIDHVTADDTKIFKEVRVKPAFEIAGLGRVFILIHESRTKSIEN